MTYLIATGVKEFWPLKGPAVMMGPWCASLFGSNHENEIHQGKMLACPWSSASEIKEAYLLAQESYSAILPKLCHALNKVHGTSYSDRYWRILIGPWLLFFTHVIYDRFSKLELAKECYPDLKFIGLDKESFITPFSTVSLYIWAQTDDLYNHQLITRLAQNMGIFIQSFRKQGLKPALKTDEKKLKDKPPSIKLQLYEYLQNKLFPYAKVVLHSTYHPKHFLAKLFLLSGGKIISCDKTFDFKNSSIISSPLVLNSTKRNELHHTINDENSSFAFSPVQLMIMKLISEEIPLVFLEGYSQLEKFTTRKFGSRYPQAICSATSWYFEESFKHWAAKAAHQGTKLISMQHGGNYGINACLVFEEHEVAIANEFLTWGWGHNVLEKKITPTPAQKLLDIKRYNFNKGKQYKEILFAGNSIRRYPIVFPLLPGGIKEYLNWQVRFFTKIDKTILSLTRFRIYNDDNQEDIRKHLEILFPTLTYENWNRSFRDSLYSCRLYVCDHSSTTFLEALASNIPTVLFWDPHLFEIRPEAQPFFESLRRVGILHDSPESAADWIKKIYEDIEDWWGQKETQNAVNDFCYHYAHTDKSSLSAWLNIFKKINKAC